MATWVMGLVNDTVPHLWFSSFKNYHYQASTLGLKEEKEE